MKKKGIDFAGSTLLDKADGETTTLNQSGTAGFYLQLFSWTHVDNYQATIEWQLIEAP